MPGGVGWGGGGEGRKDWIEATGKRIDGEICLWMMDSEKVKYASQCPT